MRVIIIKKSKNKTTMLIETTKYIYSSDWKNKQDAVTFSVEVLGHIEYIVIDFTKMNKETKETYKRILQDYENGKADL